MAQVEAIRRAMHTQPFKPFVLRLVDGTIYEVPHPDWLSIPPVPRPREVTYYATQRDGADIYETHWIDLGLILEVIVHDGQTTAPAPENGT
jgi:hypothetical protein